MAWTRVLAADELPAGSKRAVKVGETEILLVHEGQGVLHALEAKCPHAGAPLEKGAVCDGRLICPWHAGTFALEDGALLEPAPLRGLKVYAAKVESGGVLVDSELRVEPTLASRDQKQPVPPVGAGLHIVSLGAGAAAAAAVCTLRQGGFAGAITLVDPVGEEPVDRTVLTKMALAGKKPLDTVPLWSSDEAVTLRVDRKPVRAVTLNADERSLVTDTGETLRFDAALVAPGGVPKQLGVPGEQLPHVVSIRHTADVAKIDQLLGKDAGAKQVVILGDSFIAFESASALTGRGVQVTLVCRSPQPFSKKFGEAAAHALVSLHQANGVRLETGEEARSITAAAVELKSGRRLPADLVIVAVGVEPALAFAHGLALAEDGGVSVDEDLAAAEHIWAAGDVASVGDTRIEHWRLAEQHGQRAAQAMLRVFGAELAPPLGIVPYFWTFHFGKRFGYVGHAESWDEVQVDGSLGDLKFLAYYIKKGSVAAVLGCGMDTSLAMLAECLRTPQTLSDARKAAASA